MGQAMVSLLESAWGGGCLPARADLLRITTRAMSARVPLVRRFARAFADSELPVGPRRSRCSATRCALLDTGAEICTAAANSCLMQIAGALSRQRTAVQAMHLAEVLAHTETR